MLCDNIRNFRKAKGLSQDELAVKLNVVRQTVSKWEKGLSVPDSEMLVTIAAELGTTVNALLGETVEPDVNSELRIIANKLEVINGHMVRQSEARRKAWRVVFAIVTVFSAVILAAVLLGYLRFASVTGDLSGGTSVIGGADGPTSIFVSGVSFKPVPVVITGVAAAASAIGLYRTRRKQD